MAPSLTALSPHISTAGDGSSLRENLKNNRRCWGNPLAHSLVWWGRSNRCCPPGRFLLKNQRQLLWSRIILSWDLYSPLSCPGLSSDILHHREQWEADICPHRTKTRLERSHISHHLISNYNYKNKIMKDSRHLDICLVSRSHYRESLEADRGCHRSNMRHQGWKHRNLQRWIQ